MKKMMDAIMLGILGQKSNTIKKNKLKNGIEVSTVDTSDCGLETAILDKNGTHPVERYETQEEAEYGHDKWTRIAAPGITIKKLGHPEANKMGIDLSKDVILKV
jgi:hypothetical protein